jgi:hypothetical protein
MCKKEFKSLFMNKKNRILMIKRFTNMDRFFLIIKYPNFIQKNLWKKLVSVLIIFWIKEMKKKF